jgi:hypothetical protein
MKPFSFLAALVLLLATPVLAEVQRLPDEPRVFPILAWGGPPQDQTTVERFRELAGCGFTWNYSGYSTDEAVATALDA